jgi:hypothetical protein
MFYWNPKRLKELKEQGLKLRCMTLEEANREATSVKPQAARDASSKLQAPSGKEQASSHKRQAP